MSDPSLFFQERAMGDVFPKDEFGTSADAEHAAYDPGGYTGNLSDSGVSQRPAPRQSTCHPGNSDVHGHKSCKSCLRVGRSHNERSDNLFARRHK